jgi:hypothetical protein
MIFKQIEFTYNFATDDGAVGSITTFSGLKAFLAGNVMVTNIWAKGTTNLAGGAGATLAMAVGAIIIVPAQVLANYPTAGLASNMQASTSTGTTAASGPIALANGLTGAGLNPVAVTGTTTVPQLAVTGTNSVAPDFIATPGQISLVIAVNPITAGKITFILEYYEL